MATSSKKSAPKKAAKAIVKPTAKSKPAPAKTKAPAPKAKPVASKAKTATPKAKAAAPKAVAPKTVTPKVTANPKVSKPTNGSKGNGKVRSEILGAEPKDDPNMSPFLRKQRSKLLILRDSMLDSMMETAKDNLRSRAEGSEASAFGMHQADAGSDAYDRDFALNLLSQEQDALYEIDEALKRIELGTYGICEMSGKSIPHPRLEAIPFARLTVECQSQVERQNKLTRSRHAVTSLFGLTDEESGDAEESDSSDSKD